MAFSKPLATLLLLAALAAAAMSLAAAQAGCPRKLTVQNLCGHDLALTHYPVANTAQLFPAGYVLRPGTHAEFAVCSCTGRVTAPGAPEADFHLGADGGAYYRVSNSQAGSDVKVTVTPHGNPLRDHCPATGCGRARCFEFEVPSGKCHGVTEIKIVYCGP